MAEEKQLENSPILKEPSFLSAGEHVARPSEFAQPTGGGGTIVLDPLNPRESRGGGRWQDAERRGRRSLGTITAILDFIVREVVGAFAIRFKIADINDRNSRDDRRSLGAGAGRGNAGRRGCSDFEATWGDRRTECSSLYASCWKWVSRNTGVAIYWTYQLLACASESGGRWALFEGYVDRKTVGDGAKVAGEKKGWGWRLISEIMGCMDIALPGSMQPWDVVHDSFQRHATNPFRILTRDLRRRLEYVCECALEEID